MKKQDMIFSTQEDPEEIVSSSRTTNLEHPTRTYHLSSFGLLNRNGLEIPPGISLTEPAEEKSMPDTPFSAWLPIEEQWGYIPMRKFDFW